MHSENSQFSQQKFAILSQKILKSPPKNSQKSERKFSILARKILNSPSENSQSEAEKFAIYIQKILKVELQQLDIKRVTLNIKFVSKPQITPLFHKQKSVRHQL